jgi:hypothetical protein
MTEAEWVAHTDPTPMLTYLRGKASDRKLRLFAVACCRRLWPLLTDARSRRAVEVAERYADEEATEGEPRGASLSAEDVAEGFAASLATADQQAQAGAAFAALHTNSFAEQAADYCGANAGSAVFHAATAEGAPSAARSRDAERAAQSRLLRDIFGNPFRTLPAIAPAWLAWNDGTVVNLARAVYAERSLPEGTLEGDRLAILADALEEAGCADEEILRHLRSPGPHVRGCFVLDAVLSNE